MQSGIMITVIKQNSQGKPIIRYQGEITEHSSHRVVVQASWTLPRKELGYTVFEPGDTFTEYYYTDRWFNIFDIVDAAGKRKGWYCNIAEPAIVFKDHIEQVDLLLDVWVKPDGEMITLDEEEFTAETSLSNEQRSGAQRGLQMLLQMIAERQEMFSAIVASKHG